MHRSTRHMEVASGALLACALLVLIPRGFQTSNLAGGWFNFSGDSGSDVGGSTHDADISELVFEPAIDPVLLGLAVLGGFVTMLLLARFAGSSRRVYAVVDGLAIGSAAAGGVALLGVVAIAVVVHRVTAIVTFGTSTSSETSDQSAVQRDMLTCALATLIATLIAFAVFDNLNLDVVALALLFSAGTLLYMASVEAVSALRDSERDSTQGLGVLVGMVPFAVLVLIMNFMDAI